MKQNKNHGIEFEVWETEEEMQKISRHAFRIPITELDNITLRINSKPFEIINITSAGISIHLVSVDDFSVGDVIDAIELDIDGELHTFQGKVRHISPRDTAGYLCGIEFMDSIKNRKRSFLDFLQKKYKNVLTSSIITSQR